MKCKQTREVIDTASRHTLYRDSVTTHLSGCPDCRRYSDGTASLLTLLKAQPRVEASADFDFKVSMGIARAQAELLSDKTASLLALLKAQPRVEAPADFDFRLSAGIARAKAERLSQAGVFDRAWEKLARTLSLGQATAMVAAALVVVTVSTFYINHDKSSPAPSSDVATARPADLKPVKTELAREVTALAANPVRMILAKSTGRVVKVKSTMTSDDLQARNNISDNIANLEKVFSLKTQQVAQPGFKYGADEASITLAKSAPINPSL